MHTHINWNDITTPADFLNPPPVRHRIQSCTKWENTPAGIILHCTTHEGLMATLTISIPAAGTIRYRLRAVGATPQHTHETHAGTTIRPTPAMLANLDRPPLPFDSVTEQSSNSTERTLLLTHLQVIISLRLHQFEMKIKGPDDSSFFSQATQDRCYGPAFETAPLGFDVTDTGELQAREAISLAPGESIHGFGERFGTFDKRGSAFGIWATDAGSVKSQRSYKSMPMYISTRGYAHIVNTSHPCHFDIDSTSGDTISIRTTSPVLDCLVIHGPSYKTILSRFADLAGHTPMVSAWSLGFWLSRCGYQNRSEVEEVAKRMRCEGYPLDVLSLDPWWQGNAPWCTWTWDESRFPDHREMIANLAAQHIRTCLWITPYTPAGTDAYNHAESNGWLLRRADGTIAPILEAFSGADLAAIDFTEEHQTQWFLHKLDALLDEGVAVFKTDFGEQIPIDCISRDGRSGIELHNIYPMLYNEAVYSLVRTRNGVGLTWGRSGYLGSHRYPVQWGGDSYASFSHMHGQLRALLGYGLSGIPFCSHDIGGFDYEPHHFHRFDTQHHTQSVPTPTGDNSPRLGDALEPDSLSDTTADTELYIRWMQFGVFSSHCRSHGKRAHEPWAYGELAASLTKQYLRLRYRLLPYIYTQALESSRTGIPFVRPMVLEFQDDKTTWNIETQYLFGSDILAAPVLDRTDHADVYLPAGSWMDFWTGQVLNGSAWHRISAPLEQMPLLVRSHSIIPLAVLPPEGTPLSVDTLDLQHLEALVFEPQDNQTLAVLWEGSDGQPTLLAQLVYEAGGELHPKQHLLRIEPCRENDPVHPATPSDSVAQAGQGNPANPAYQASQASQAGCADLSRSRPGNIRYCTIISREKLLASV